MRKFSFKKAMKLTLILFFGLVFLESGYAEHTSNWDHCNCHFLPWQSWSDCTTQCGGGRQEREQRVSYTQGRGCTKFTDCATPGSGWQHRNCNEKCYNGGTYNGWYCSCPSRWKGSCCDEEVNCGNPGTIKNGSVLGSNYAYGSTVSYVCINGFNLTRGSIQQTCTAGGYWSGRKPLCLFANTCHSNPCQNGGTCVDDLERYDCKCLSGWAGEHCEIDEQPPLQHDCPVNVTINIATQTTVVNWTEPSFYDPMKNKLQITKNYPKNEWEFHWGDFRVQYTATKLLNGLRTECVFVIKVRPHPCGPLHVPGKHLARVCTNWKTDYGQYCLPFCNENFKMRHDNLYDQWNVCGASGKWIPSPDLPQCDIPVDKTVANTRNHFHYDNCNNVQSMNQMKEVFINRLNSSEFAFFCRKFHDQCMKENVDLHCN